MHGSLLPSRATSAVRAENRRPRTRSRPAEHAAIVSIALWSAACGKLLPAAELDSGTTESPSSTSTSAATSSSTTTTGMELTGLDDSTASSTGSMTTLVGSESSTGIPEPECGNGIVEPGEVCFELEEIADLTPAQCSIAIGDILNNDGHPELVTVPCALSNIRIFPGSDQGLDNGIITQELSEGIGGGFLRGIALGDYTNDGLVDIVVPDFDTTVVVYHNADAAPFSIFTVVPTPGSYFPLMAGDLDGVPPIDLVAGSASYGEIQLFTATGDSLAPLDTLQPLTPELTMYDAKLADLDDSGDQELILAARGTTARLEVYGRMGPVFDPAPQLIEVKGLFDVAAGDFDGTPGLELAVSQIDLEMVMAFSLEKGVTYGRGQQLPFGPGAPQLLGSADFNQDGVDDLVSTQKLEGGNSLVVSTSVGGESFSFDPALTVSLDSREATDEGKFLRVADLNHDGVPDVVVVTTTSRILQLLSNP